MSYDKKTAVVVPLKNPYSRFVSITSSAIVVSESIVNKDAPSLFSMVMNRGLQACETDYIECVISFSPEPNRMFITRNGSLQIKAIDQICNLLEVERVGTEHVAIHGALSTKAKVLRRADSTWLSMLLMKNMTDPHNCAMTHNPNLKPFNVRYDLFFSADCLRRVYLKSGNSIIEIVRVSGETCQTFIYSTEGIT